MSVWNRPPLVRNAFARLPIGSIRARGWLHEQLRLSADGLTGHLMEIWPDVGPESGWLGGSGENWERGPYYARGLAALAYALGHPPLIDCARSWIEWSLRSQRADGFFGPADNDDWWARMPMLDAMRLHADATGDVRIAPFLARYFRYQLAQLPGKPLRGWAVPRGGDNLDAALWLYNRTGEQFLLELADLLHRQTSDWIGEFARGHSASEAFEFAHGVNRAMGLKEPAVYFQRSADATHLAAVRRGWQTTLRDHGQIQGTFSCDELLHGRGPTQGTEFCAIVELLASLQTALVISGELWLADAMERIAYNALPAIWTADHRGHQYFQQANQIACTRGPHHFWFHHDTDLLFGPFSGYGCCAANGHLAWPQLTHHLWLATPSGGLAAMLFAPCEVTAVVGDGARVSIIEETDYPFADEVQLTIRAARPVAFPLALRLPGWAAACTVAVNGECRDCRVASADGTLITEARTWRDGDRVVVKLPMPPRVSSWHGSGVGVERGPLVYALRIEETWRRVGGSAAFAEYEVRAATPWNYGLLLDPHAAERSVRVVRRPGATQPWAQDGAPVALTVPGKRLPDWSAENDDCGPIPASGQCPDVPVEILTLIPFGCARLRIAVFPTVR